jgi:dihydrofolate synthase/folylpolyglutamate synthase
VTPIGVDHAHYLGDTVEEIAVEKAGIIKPGATAVLTEQLPGPAEILLRRCAEVEATPVREGVEFGVTSRIPAVGGQLLTLQGLRAEYDEIFLPLYGAHQAQNAVAALAAVEAFLGDQPLDAELVRDAFARVTSPGRLEIIRRSPMILLDAAHNPHGAERIAEALEDSFAFEPLIGVIGVMADKEYEGVLAAFEPHLAHVVCTQNSTSRALPAARLAVTAREVFGGDRVTVAPRLEDAIDEATTLAEAGEALGSSIGSGAVLVTGSVVTVGEARAMLRRRGRSADRDEQDG